MREDCRHAARRKCETPRHATVDALDRDRIVRVCIGAAAFPGRDSAARRCGGRAVAVAPCASVFVESETRYRPRRTGRLLTHVRCW